MIQNIKLKIKLIKNYCKSKISKIKKKIQANHFLNLKIKYIKNALKKNEKQEKIYIKFN